MSHGLKWLRRLPLGTLSALIIGTGATVGAPAIPEERAVARGTFSGRGLVQVCGSEDPERRVACISYVAGIFDALAVPQPGREQPVLCADRAVSFDELRELAFDALMADPELLSRPALQPIVTALVERFPCETPGKAPPPRPEASPPRSEPPAEPRNEWIWQEQEQE